MKSFFLTIGFLSAIFIASGQQKEIEIVAVSATNGIDSNCLPMGSCVYQTIRITNNDSVDVSDIPLVLNICDKHGVVLQTIYDILWGILQANSSQNLTFAQCYHIPEEKNYVVVVCATVDTNVYCDTLTECVDLDDIEVVDILNPLPIGHHNIGSEVNLEVQLVNNSISKTYQNVVVNAHIIDVYTSDVILQTVTINNFVPGTRICRFTPSYTVPSVSNYIIKVFIDNVDNYPFNDTLIRIQSTCLCLGITDYTRTDFALYQNIPNPANEITRIDYKIPTDGEVVFCVYNIAGQLLYTETVEAIAGKQSWELNTRTLANGIYYYSMTFNGEKLVKKMNIQR